MYCKILDEYEKKLMSLGFNTVACVQTLLIPFQTGSPPVESAHQRPNPCCEFMRNMEPFLIGRRISPFFHERLCLYSSLQVFN